MFLRYLLLFCLIVSSAFTRAGHINFEPMIQEMFPKATVIEPPLDGQVVWRIYQLHELLGYAFQTNDVVDIPGFSGDRINMMIGLDTKGTLKDIRLIHHHEPIFMHGLGPEPMLAFIKQYVGHALNERIIIGGKGKEDSDGTYYFDGVTKATVSVIVMNDTILSSALKVARKNIEAFAGAAESRIREDYFAPASFAELLDKQWIFNHAFQAEEIADQLGNRLDFYSEFQDVEDELDQTSQLYIAYVSVPSVGINLLGESEFDHIRESLKPGEHAFLVMSKGWLSFLEPDFKPGTAPSRLALRQDGLSIPLRDTDFGFSSAQSLAFIEQFDQVKLFKVGAQAGFNPGENIDVDFTIFAPQNPLITDEAKFNYALSLNPEFFEIVESVDDEITREPLWLRIWRDRTTDIGILGIALLLLTIGFIKQKQLVANASRFAIIRWSFLAFTVSFVGYYTQGQLSVVNIYTLFLEIYNGFDIGVFLLDPIIFILWVYTFISLFLWGRGLFCGWLCPFGALQEMAAWLGNKLRIKPTKISAALHNKAIYIKYVVLVVLTATAFISLQRAEQMAEIEPFKTAITLNFVREWPFVIYAVLLLIASMRIHKFFCRYLCPLGAGLAVLGRFRIFEWLTRRKECGQPCQVCTKRCGINAIDRQGSIDYNECIQCLECVVIIADEKQCAPLMLDHKKNTKAQVIKIGN